MAEDKVYVTLQPNSNTNRSSAYAVADSQDWASFVNGESPYLVVHSSFSDFKSAKAMQDGLNKGTEGGS